MPRSCALFHVSLGVDMSGMFLEIAGGGFVIFEAGDA